MTVHTDPSLQSTPEIGAPAWPRHVLLAADGSEASQAALDVVQRFHLQPGSVLEVVTAHERGAWLLPQDLLHNQQAEAAVLFALSNESFRLRCSHIQISRRGSNRS